MAAMTEQTLFALSQGQKTPVHILTSFSVSRTVGDLQRRIAVAINQSASWNKIKLMVDGVELNDWAQPLDSCNVANGDTVYFLLPDTTSTPPYTPPAAWASGARARIRKSRGFEAGDGRASGSGTSGSSQTSQTSQASSASPASQTSNGVQIKVEAPVRLIMRNCTTNRRFTLKHVPLDMKVKRLWKKLEAFGVHRDASFFFEEVKMRKDTSLAEHGIMDGSMIDYLEPC